MRLASGAGCDGTAGERVLDRLKRGGPATLADLATALGVTAEATRQVVGRLEEAGLVHACEVAHGPGRPARRWGLTPAGHARFPDRHAQLAAELVAALREECGEAVVARVLDRRAREVEAGYARELADLPLAERVARLAALRDAEGYLARVEVDDGGGLLLVEDHCAIGAAARACGGLCAEELRVFRAVLPDAEVERTEHLLAGDRRCAYRVRPRA